MKGNGLSSTHREALKKLNRRSNHASNENGILAAKERQKALRMLNEKAWVESQKRSLPKVGDSNVAAVDPSLKVDPSFA